MAATTLATSLDLIDDYELRELITEFCVKPDPLFRRMPFVTSPGGWQWKQRYTSEPSGGAAMVITDTMLPSAFTEYEHAEHLRLAYKMDQYNPALAGMGTGQQGHNDRDTKRKHILAGLSKYVRQSLIDGAHETVAIGATLTALGLSACVPGPKISTFAQTTAGTTSLGKIKWTLATNTVQYMGPGYTAYGAGVVLSATNYFRVPLFSGGDVTGSTNPFKWIWATFVWATISVAANYESDTTAAKGLTYTPSKAMTGLICQASPAQWAWHDLTLAGAAAAPPLSGGSMNRENLTWAAMKLLDASNDNPSRCCFLCDDYLMNAIEGVITSLGASVPATMFMGEQLSGALSYKSIVFLRNRFIPTLTARDGVTTVRQLVGVVLGEDGFHMKYSRFANNPSFVDQVSSFQQGVVAQDETGNMPIAPVMYWEQKDSAATLPIDQFAVMIAEPVVANVDKTVIVGGLTV